MFYVLEPRSYLVPCEISCFSNQKIKKYCNIPIFDCNCDLVITFFLKKICFSTTFVNSVRKVFTSRSLRTKNHFKH